MAKTSKKLDNLFHDTLKDIYFCEKKILTALPKMAKAAKNDDLKAAFEKHHAQTEQQVKRLDQVFALIDAKPQGKNCPAIMGMIEEGQEVIAEYHRTRFYPRHCSHPPSDILPNAERKGGWAQRRRQVEMDGDVMILDLHVIEQT